jgi:hypothetical protein
MTTKKAYAKPALKKLGLLRLLTRLSPNGDNGHIGNGE